MIAFCRSKKLDRAGGSETTASHDTRFYRGRVAEGGLLLTMFFPP